MSDKVALALERFDEIRAHLIKDTIDGKSSAATVGAALFDVVNLAREFIQEVKDEDINKGRPHCFVCGENRSTELNWKWDEGLEADIYLCTDHQHMSHMATSSDDARAETLAWLGEVRSYLSEITFMGQRGNEYHSEDNWRLLAEIDKADPNGRVYIQVQHWRKDALTEEFAWGHSRKQYLSEHMPVSEIIRQAFSLFLGYQEHEVREGFRYRGKQIFGPHIDVEALLKVADDLDVRS